MSNADTFSIMVSVLLAVAALTRMTDHAAVWPEKHAYAFAAVMFILAAATRLMAALL